MTHIAGTPTPLTVSALRGQCANNPDSTAYILLRRTWRSIP